MIGQREDGGRYVGTAQDVSVARLEQQALIEAERGRRTLAAIVAESEDAVIAKTLPDGVITDWNRGAQRIYGYTAAEIVGRPISLLLPPERRGEEHELMREAMADRSVPQYETTRVRKDGSVIDVSVTVSPIHSANRQIVGASVITCDITERKLRERDLRRSEASLADAQCMAHIGSWSWEPATDSTEWSAEMYRIFARDPGQGPAASDAFFAYLHPEDRGRIGSGYVQAFGAENIPGNRWRLTAG